MQITIGPGFEYYPQASQYQLSAGSGKFSD